MLDWFSGSSELGFAALKYVETYCADRFDKFDKIDNDNLQIEIDNYRLLTTYPLWQAKCSNIHSFNFLCNFVLCSQLCVLYSTYIQHSTRYSIFNFPFNIQLFILNSILHLPIQLSMQQFQLFVQHSIIHSTFNYSRFIKSFEPSLLLVSTAYQCLLKTWRRWLECRLRK